MIDLARLAKLAAEATPGPWGTAGNYRQNVYIRRGESVRYLSVQHREDASYIAECSPEVVAALVRLGQAALRHADSIEHVGDWREAEEEFDEALAPFRGDA